MQEVPGQCAGRQCFGLFAPHEENQRRRKYPSGLARNEFSSTCDGLSVTMLTEQGPLGLAETLHSLQAISISVTELPAFSTLNPGVTSSTEKRRLSVNG